MLLQGRYFHLFKRKEYTTLTLLLNTDIQKQVDNHITGFTARVGGSVNQLINYKKIIVEDINIPDGGFGSIQKISLYNGIFTNYIILKTYLKQEIDYNLKGSIISRDRKTKIFDVHDAVNHDRLINTYESLISSNVIEHSPNPIFWLLNTYYITKIDGYQFHAIPHRNYTYDRFRSVTSVSHLLNDFINHANNDDESHTQDYYESAVVKDGWQRDFHQRYPLKYPFIHFHVFDEQNSGQLFNLLFYDVTHDILKTDKFSDNVVIFRNRIKESFISSYSDIIKQYSEKLYLKCIAQ